MESNAKLRIVHSSLAATDNLVDQLLNLQEELRYIDSVLTKIDVSQDGHTRKK